MDILVTFNLIITNVEICLAFYFAHFGIILSQSPRILSPPQQRINLLCVQYSNKSMLSRLLFIFSYMKSVCLPIYQSSLSTSSKLLKNMETQAGSLFLHAYPWWQWNPPLFYLLSHLPEKSTWETGMRNEYRIHCINAWRHQISHWNSRSIDLCLAREMRVKVELRVCLCWTHFFYLYVLEPNTFPKLPGTKVNSRQWLGRPIHPSSAQPPTVFH